MASTRSILRPQRVARAAAVGIGLYTLLAYHTRSVVAESPEPPKTFAGSFNFVSLRLHSSEAVNQNTKRLRFELPDTLAQSGLKPTSSLLTISRPQGSWFLAVRPYTPVSDLEEPGYIEFLVKHYPNGKASTHLHSMTPGETLYFAGPIKSYQWTANKHPQVALIAGGAGITPMYQLLRGILKDPDDKTKITLVWGVNTDADVFLRDELDRLQQKYPDRLRLFYTVSNPVHGSPYPKGYVTKELLEKADLTRPDGDTKVFVCGPPAMEASMTGGKGARDGVLTQLGYTPGQVHRFQ